MTAKILPSSLALALINGSGVARADKIKLPESGTTVTAGGYVKLDAIWNDVSAGVDSVGHQELSTSLIPVGATAGQHKKQFSAQDNLYRKDP